MESSPDNESVGRTPERELADVKRAAARAHLEYPPTPAWVWPALGVAAAACTWSYSLEQPFPGLAVFWASLGLCWWVIAQLTRERGAFPSFSTMPRSLKREAIWTWAQVLVLVPVTVLIWRLVGPIAATILAGVAFAGLMYAHQRRYDTIATALRSDDPSPAAPG